MIKVAVYGKGGIGKSTTVSNVAAALAEKGMKVMQIGCDPKADSTILLRHGKKVPTVLELYNEKRQELKLTDMVQIGYGGVVCVEAGGPAPGLGCAGRGIITALEKLKENGAYETYKPDIVFYDVLGDVVCGGFSMPMRKGYADKVFIITSGENMAIHAGANIAMAVDNFRNRGYIRTCMNRHIFSRCNNKDFVCIPISHRHRKSTTDNVSEHIIKHYIRLVFLICTCLFEFFQCSYDSASCAPKSRCRASCFYTDNSFVSNFHNIFQFQVLFLFLIHLKYGRNLFSMSEQNR